MSDVPSFHVLSERSLRPSADYNEWFAICSNNLLSQIRESRVKGKTEDEAIKEYADSLELMAQDVRKFVEIRPRSPPDNSRELEAAQSKDTFGSTKTPEKDQHGDYHTGFLHSGIFWAFDDKEERTAMGTHKNSGAFGAFDRFVKRTVSQYPHETVIVGPADIGCYEDQIRWVELGSERLFVDAEHNSAAGRPNASLSTGTGNDDASCASCGVS